MNKVEALNNFWNSFHEGDDWKAYEASTVRPDVTAKHITYDISYDDFNHPIAQTVSLWDTATSWNDLIQKTQEIANKITRGGIMVPYDDGAMWIKKANPWAQQLSDSEQERRMVLNIEIEFID